MRPFTSMVDGGNLNAVKQAELADEDADRIIDFNALLSAWASLPTQSLISFSSQHMDELEGRGSVGQTMCERSKVMIGALVLLAGRAEGGRPELEVREHLFARARPWIDDWVDCFLQLTLRRDRRRLIPTTCD